jgi:hypothetical protein
MFKRIECGDSTTILEANPFPFILHIGLHYSEIDKGLSNDLSEKTEMTTASAVCWFSDRKVKSILMYENEQISCNERAGFLQRIRVVYELF